MRKAFDIEDINLEDLIATAMDDPQALPARARRFTASISPICKPHTGSSARTRPSPYRRSISAT
jgi:hypothetical protein